ncbi:restriction endonuclease [Stenotrophomonas maltophilia]|nr:restriction endonuclease [Stenotrophomonas maltophilia]
MAIDLTDVVGLRQACAEALGQHRKMHHLDDWLQDIATWIERVKGVQRSEFLSTGFQQELWNGETIAATGQGHVDVSRVVNDPATAEKLWELWKSELPDTPMARSAWFGAAWDEVRSMVSSLTNRMPRLKLYRVFASLWPGHFTTIAHYQKLLVLARAMGIIPSSDHRTELHQRVLDRLDAAGVEMLSAEERMALPWVLYVHFAKEQGAASTEHATDAPATLRLNPLPADRRRRGMLAMNGGLQSVVAMLEFAEGGCKRADMLEHIRSVNPKLATSSLATNLNALMAEWGALRAVGDDLHLTPRGEALLATGEAEEVSDWLLTRVLGFDNLLYLLRQGPSAQKQAVTALQQVNPGWTSDYAPTAMINWAKTMSLATLGPDKVLTLTDRGQEWAARIEWVPGVLTSDPKGAPVTAAAVTSVEEDLWSQLPSVAAILATFPRGLVFNSGTVARLHAGLWNRRHPRRHFAVLTGLSGAGKTQLAKRYATALWAGHEEVAGWLAVPVQPGWHDPSSLLGYVNPLNSEVYVRTRFLDFMLAANADPDRPYIVLLDEMNLSHPEQYLAPLLSAMESDEAIELHSFGEDLGDVPARIPYPPNLVIIGTVNMDETTHGLSDKVLDRASVIEFWDIDVAQYPGWAGDTLLNKDQLARVRKLMEALMAPLRPVRLHFGWRTMGDVLGFVEAAVGSAELDMDTALDHAIYSKILPKLRGEDSTRMRVALEKVAQVLKAAGLAQSAGRVTELLEDLQQFGSARFWR